MFPVSRILSLKLTANIIKKMGLDYDCGSLDLNQDLPLEEFGLGQAAMNAGLVLTVNHQSSHRRRITPLPILCACGAGCGIKPSWVTFDVWHRSSEVNYKRCELLVFAVLTRCNY